MIRIILILLTLYSLPSFAQNQISDIEYRTRKGDIIKVGDTLTIGVGSLPDGTFNYVSESSTLGPRLQMKKRKSNGKLVVVEITGGMKQTDNNIYIKCTFVGKEKPWVFIKPDAAFIKEEIYLPGQ